LKRIAILIQILEDIHHLSKLRYLNAKVKNKKNSDPPDPYSDISRIAVVKFFPCIVKHCFGLMLAYISGSSGYVRYGKRTDSSNMPMRIQHVSFQVPVASKSNKAIAFLLRVQSLQNQQKE
jgi:hypothetical protein